MARRRMISPEIWQSEDFSRLSILARVVFVGLFSQADDYGRGRAKAVYIKSLLFPYDVTISPQDVDKALTEISQNMSIVFYEIADSEYYQLNNWDAWQRVDRPQESNIPVFFEGCKVLREQQKEPFDNSARTIRESCTNHSTKMHESFDENARTIRDPFLPKGKEYKGKEDKGKERNDFCPEPEPVSEPEAVEEAVAELELNTGDCYRVTQKQVDKWSALYPAVDVMQELRNMSGWLDGNPSRRKTKGGVLRFINGWLAREQDKGRPAAAKTTGPPADKVEENYQRLKEMFRGT